MWIITAELDTLKIQNVSSENNSPIDQIVAEFDEDEQLWFVHAVYYPVPVRRKGNDYLYVKSRRMAGPFAEEEGAFGFIRGLGAMLVQNGMAALMYPLDMSMEEE